MVFEPMIAAKRGGRVRKRRVAVIGAGIGGMVGALLLAARGFDVTVLESAATPGGKLRQIAIGSSRIDAGPTVLTMRWAFDEIFEEAGASFAERVAIAPLPILARHAWSDGSQLDLHADIDQSAEAIGRFAGRREAEGFRAFSQRARAIYKTLETPFLRGSRPNLFSLTARVGLSRISELWRISPFATLDGALGQHFRDPRLRQLFGRYATYCGSSPFLAPATLMLIAHVEQCGVWTLEGGMFRLAEALADLARERGAAIHYGKRVTRILVEKGRACGVVAEDGERFTADAVLFNGDCAALAARTIGPEAAKAAAETQRSPDSLSAVTWAMVGRPEGFDLSRHNVFFSDDYRAEFDELLRDVKLPREPTIYVCAQDRTGASQTSEASESLFCLVNAPPVGGQHRLSAKEIDACERATFLRLERMGLTIRPGPSGATRAGPDDFEAMFPATRGALYGPASHGWRASFARPGSRTHLPGLYLAGGSVHPGPGAPMAALSGRLAAARIAADLTSRFQSVRGATLGGMSTR